jgi:transglutaminase-like putative cysteine protease
MPNLSVRHITRYRYRRPVGLGEHRMMFRPRESYDQRVLESRLVIVPEPVELRYVHDVFGNCVGIARFDTPADELVFDSLVRLEHSPTPVVNDADDEFDCNATYPFAYSVEDLPDLLRSIERDHPDPDRTVEAWARRFVKPAGPTGLLDMLSDMTGAIRAEFTYGTRLEGGAQTPLQTLAAGSGSCRDFAVLMIEAVRSLGLAARFVSGYIYSPAAGRGDARRLGGGHTHAWVRVYLPSCGWVEFDPTNGIVGSDDLIRVAVARDPRQALPLCGSYVGEAADYLGMDVSVDVGVEGAAAHETVGRRAFALAS